MRALKALLAALLLLVAFPAAAEVRVTFYSHAWNAGGDGMYPHAFIRVTGRPSWAQAPVDETYGFTTKQQALVFLKARVNVGARIAPATPAQNSCSANDAPASAATAPAKQARPNANAKNPNPSNSANASNKPPITQ